MIQRYEHARLGVNRRDIGTLVQVATDTAEAQVSRVIGPSVLFSNDMVDLMRQKRCALRKSAVFARILRAPYDQFPHIARDFHDAARTVQTSSV